MIICCSTLIRGCRAYGDASRCADAVSFYGEQAAADSDYRAGDSAVSAVDAFSAGGFAGKNESGVSEVSAL